MRLGYVDLCFQALGWACCGGNDRSKTLQGWKRLWSFVTFEYLQWLEVSMR